MERSSRKKLTQLGELGFIDLVAKLAHNGRACVKGIGDDTAVLPFTRNKQLLFTTDMLKEGVHFTKKTKMKAIGYKALACSISDIAAMGGYPTYALVSLGVPRDLDILSVKMIYEGMNTLAKRFKIGIIGGDTILSHKIIINIALLGEVEKQHLVLRSEARKGDKIFVTGPLGRSFKTGKHLSFTPRIYESRYLVKSFQPTSMIDISDGLVADLGHILKASSVGALICEQRIPKNPKANLTEVLYGGEDFELIFTLSPNQANRMQRKKNKKFKFYCIGDIVNQKEKFQLICRTGKRRNIEAKGFVHF